MSAKIPPEGLLERIVSGHGDAILGELLQQMQTLTAEQAKTNNILAAVITSAPGGGVATPETGTSGSTKPPIFAGLTPGLNLPISPAVLIHSVIAADNPGIAQLLFLAKPVSVPANGTATYTYTVPSGDVTLFAAPFRVYPSTVTTDVTGTLVVDGVDVLLDNFPMVGSPIEAEMPQYGVVRNTLVSTWTNNTSSPVTVTLYAQICNLLAKDYDQKWSPLFRHSYDVLGTYAESLVARGLV